MLALLLPPTDLDQRNGFARPRPPLRHRVLERLAGGGLVVGAVREVGGQLRAGMRHLRGGGDEEWGV